MNIYECLFSYDLDKIINVGIAENGEKRLKYKEINFNTIFDIYEVKAGIFYFEADNQKKAEHIAKRLFQEAMRFINGRMLNGY